MTEPTNKLDMQSPDLVNQNFEKLAQLFPNCVTGSGTGKAIDFDLLKQELSHAVVEGNKERYRLEWPGKREAIVTANLPTTKTLRPVREDSVDFDNTENIYIEGDNLEVLKLLQESYLGKIKMIYIDPPYNTGNDFVYKDNFSKDKEGELFESGQKDELSQRLVVNPETSGRYHSDWLSMMYPRLKLARNLLRDDGVIFISIDDHEQANLKRLCDEVFGEQNFVANIAVVNNIAGRSDKKHIATGHEYVLAYSKSDFFDSTGLPLSEKNLAEYKFEDETGKFRLQGLRKRGSGALKEDRPNMFYPVFYDKSSNTFELERKNASDIEIIPKLSDGSLGRWRWGKDTFVNKKDFLSVRLVEGRNEYDVFEKVYLELNGIGKSLKMKSFLMEPEYTTDNATSNLRGLLGNKLFDTPKPVKLIQDFIRVSKCDSNQLILDFFSGSSTTAHAVMQLNAEDGGKRKFIMVQIPSVCEGNEMFTTICEIGKERIRRAGAKIKADTGADIDYGFRVYRLDESNMQDVYYRPQDLNPTKLDMFADNVKPDRTEDDLLAQVMLDWGLPLSLKIEQANVAGKKIFKVADNSLFACFDNGIDEAFAKEIAKETPLRIVFKDAGFKDDTAKTNVKQLLKQLSPETEMKVL